MMAGVRGVPWSSRILGSSSHDTMTSMWMKASHAFHGNFYNTFTATFRWEKVKWLCLPMGSTTRLCGQREMTVITQQNPDVNYEPRLSGPKHFPRGQVGNHLHHQYHWLYEFTIMKKPKPIRTSHTSILLKCYGETARSCRCRSL